MCDISIFVGRAFGYFASIENVDDGLPYKDDEQSVSDGLISQNNATKKIVDADALGKNNHNVSDGTSSLNNATPKIVDADARGDSDHDFFDRPGPTNNATPKIVDVEEIKIQKKQQASERLETNNKKQSRVPATADLSRQTRASTKIKTSHLYHLRK